MWSRDRSRSPWAFASLMRQLNIDCVVLYPAGGETTENSPFSDAVLLNDQAFVFDTRLGLPIPLIKSRSACGSLWRVVSSRSYWHN